MEGKRRGKIHRLLALLQVTEGQFYRIRNNAHGFGLSTYDSTIDSSVRPVRH